MVLLHDRTSDITNANDSRNYLVTQKTRSLENLPPLKKCQTTHQQARYYSAGWKKVLTAMQELPDPANWGWKRNTTGWEPL